MVKDNKISESINLNNTIKPSIFTKKIGNIDKKTFFNPIDSTLGETRHYPAAIREWSSSICNYNTNSMKNLPVMNKVLSRIVKSYFNLSLPTKHLTKVYRKAKGLSLRKINTRFVRLSLKRIFVGKPVLKHTNNKVIITLLIYDGQRKFLERRTKLLRRLNDFTNNFLKWLNREKYTKIGKDSRKKSISIKREMFNNLDFIRKHFFSKTEINDNSNFIFFKSKKMKYGLDLAKPLLFACGDNIKRIYDIKRNMHDALMPLIRAKSRLLVNELKFSKFIVRLTPLIIRLYGKEVEFNLIKLQRMYFNSDIFTQAIAIKIKNRNNRLLRVMRSAISMAKVPKFDPIWKQIVDKKGFVYTNKAKNLYLGCLNKSIEFNPSKDYLNQMLMYILPINKKHKNIPVLNKNSLEAISIESRENKLEGLDHVNNIYDSAISKLKYKTMAGVRIEAKGRLTRRFTASRFVFKVRWKGGLKDVDSSYRGLSSVILRGNIKPNIDYSLVNSKTRNGAFGIKGWVSGL